MEAGEQVREAAIREAKEETGLEVAPVEVLGIYDEPGRDPRGPVISVVYACSTDQEELEADTDADEARWFSLDEIPDEMGFDHRDILEQYTRAQER